MGNCETDNSKEGELKSIKHYHLSNSKITTFNKQNTLKYTPCLDRKEYERWKNLLANYHPHPSLFLPLQHSFHPTNLCGNGGNA